MPDKDNTKINIIKPDGRIMQGTREELKNLQILGDYREEGASDLAYRQGEAQTERDYSTITDKLKTAGMGAISGATDRKSTRLNSSHEFVSRMPSSA